MIQANDPPIHLKKDSVKLEIWLPQDHLDGLAVLIQWAKGVEDFGGKGNVPGLFELIMHYREIRSKVLASKQDG